MIKTVRLIIVLLSGFTLWSQSIKNSSGNLVDGDFDVCPSAYTPTPGLFLNACHYIEEYPDCSKWDYESNNSAIFCEQGVALSNINDEIRAYNGRGHGLLIKKVENNEVTQNGKLKANLDELIVGQSYRLVFYQLNLGVPYGDAEGLDAAYVLTIGEESYLVPAIPYVAGDRYSEHWFESVITFCATAESMPLTITSDILNSDSDMSCYLAIDGIRIEQNQGNNSCTIPCVNCNSFELVRGKEYFISGWVKQTNSTYVNINVPSYSDSFIEVLFFDSLENVLPGPVDPYAPAGEIIDGWQKISGVFTVPINAGEINIRLVNSTNNRVFFDDIRVHPIDSNLKSFVYDQASQKLMAELDENNYATFYEYDKEGGLVRVKKETERGVLTIQETRSSNRKKEGE